VLINNAGGLDTGPIEAGDLDRWDEVLDLNVRALMQLTRLALPEILKGKQAFANLGVHCATKHAVVGFSNVLFEEVRDRGVRVSVICPGLVETELVSSWDVPFEKALRPEDVALVVLFALASPPSCCPTELVLNPQQNPYA